MSALSILSLSSFSFSPYSFFTGPATPEIYTLSLHDALPISRSSSPPGWWPAPRMRTGRGTQAGTFTVAGAVTGVVGAVTAAGRAGAGAGTLPARTVAEVVELSDETAVALGTPLALSFFLWRPPPAALRPSQAHPASHRGPFPHGGNRRQRRPRAVPEHGKAAAAAHRAS